MKKILVLLLVVMTVAFAFVGCAKEEETAGGITVGLVTDTGGIDDKSFNQGTWEGIVRYAEEAELSESDYRFIQSVSDADYITNLSQFADEDLDLIVAPGFLFVEAMAEVAADYPEQKFLIIDSVVDATNVASAVFAEEQGSFLVGVAAALKAEEAGMDTVGFLGGMDFELIQKFEAGFEAGVYAVNPDMNILVEYAGSFADNQKGQTLAAKMYDDGAYVIYHAAGATGNGLFKEAKDRAASGQDVWAIGVDKDQYEEGIYEGETSVVLTSMVKRVDNASYDVCKAVANEEFAGDVLVFSLSNEGVGIPSENPNLKDEWVTSINDYKDKIVNGEIEVPTLPTRLQ